MNYDPSAIQNNRSTISTEENMSELKYEDIVKNSDILNSNETLTDIEISKNQYTSEDLNKIIKDYRDIEEKLEDINERITNKFQTNINNENISNIFRSCSSNEIEQLESRIIIENNTVTHQVERITESTETSRNNDNKVKASLTEELLKLSNYGWYWGPISGNEADAKLLSEPDGAFLVRDSSDDRLFFLSFLFFVKNIAKSM